MSLELHHISTVCRYIYIGRENFVNLVNVIQFTNNSMPMLINTVKLLKACYQIHQTFSFYLLYQQQFAKVYPSKIFPHMLSVLLSYSSKLYNTARFKLMLAHTVPASNNSRCTCAQLGSRIFIDLHTNGNPLRLMHEYT